MTTVTVGSGQQFTSIQAAVDANPQGTTFNILPGTYHESITPKTGDIFNGAGMGSTILDGQNTLGTGFGGSANNVTITGMTIKNFTTEGITLQTWTNTGWTMDHVEIAFCTDGIRMGTNTTFENGSIHDIAYHPMHLTGNGMAMSNSVVVNNDIYNNNTSHTSPFGTTADAGLKYNGGGNDIFANNRIHDNYGNGLWFDSNHQGAQIYGNEIYNNGPGAAVAIEIDMPQTTATPIYSIHDNYIHNNDGGIGIANSGNVEIYNNALSGNTGYQIEFFDEGNRGNAVNGLPMLNENISVHNNWIAYSSGVLGGNDSGYNHWHSQNNAINNNAYYLPTGAAAFVDNGTLFNQAGWQADGEDALSTFTYNGGALPAGVGPRGGYTGTATVSPSPTPTPIPSPTSSADGSTLSPGSGGSLVTSDGTWTFSTATAGGGNVILLNGQPAANGAATLLLVEQGHMYADNAQASWYEWLNGAWSGTSNPTPTPSPSGSSLSTGAAGSLVTSDGTWTFSATTAGGGNVILLNGQAAANGAANELVVENGHMFADNAQGSWYEWVNSAWAQVSPPTSPDGSSLAAGASGSLLTNEGVWTFSTATAAGGHAILLNGQPAASGAANTLLVEGGHLFADSAQGNWYEWVNSAWSATTDPTAAPAPAPGQALAPTLSVQAASGNEGTSIPLAVTAAQADSNLSAANLSVSISGLQGATLNHGTLNADGSYTLHAADLQGLTITPGSEFTGHLALTVTATDSEPASHTTAASAAQTLGVTVNPVAEAPTLSVQAASGNEGTAIPLAITGTQAESDLAPANLTVSVSGLKGASLNHGTLNHDGSYTLHTADLQGLTLTSASQFSGNLALTVTATDSEASSHTTATSAAQTLGVTVNMTPTFSDGVGHDLFVFSSPAQNGAVIANFDPAQDVLDLAPLLKADGYKGTNAVQDHVVTLAQAGTDSTAVMVDPTGVDPNHGTTLVTLAHVLPTDVHATNLWA